MIRPLSTSHSIAPAHAHVVKVEARLPQLAELEEGVLEPPEGAPALDGPAQ
jgi:hypothetical protein